MIRNPLKSKGFLELGGEADLCGPKIFSGANHHEK